MSSHEHLWITYGEKRPDSKYLNPYALYEFLPVNVDKTNVRIQSAPVMKMRIQQVPNAWTRLTPSSTLKNPSPSPASTSRPTSAKSLQYNKVSSLSKMPKSIVTESLVRGKVTTRCKSAPAVRPQMRQEPSVRKPRASSAFLSSRSASQRAWRLRTNSAKRHHNILSPEEIHSHHIRARCKSAPLPYDFSNANVILTVPENGTDEDKLKAMTRPLSCMPQIVQNVLNHNGLRHCCSAYQANPKTVPVSQKQFWPIARPAKYKRGFVPNYINFIKPVSLSSRSSGSQANTKTIDDYEEVNYNVIEDAEIFEQDVSSRLPSGRVVDDGFIQTELYEDRLNLEPSEYLCQQALDDKNKVCMERPRRSSLTSQDGVSNIDDVKSCEVGDKTDAETTSAGRDQQLFEDEVDLESQAVEMESTITQKNFEKHSSDGIQPNTEDFMVVTQQKQMDGLKSDSLISEAQATSLSDSNKGEDLEGSLPFSKDVKGFCSINPENNNPKDNLKPFFTPEKLSNSLEIPQDNVSTKYFKGTNKVLSATSGKSSTFSEQNDSPKVKFEDSAVITSYTPPRNQREEETTLDTHESILKMTKEEKNLEPTAELTVNNLDMNPELQKLPQKAIRPTVERRDADIKKQSKPNPKLVFLESKLSKKKEEPKMSATEARQLEQNESLSEGQCPTAEFVSRPGAYKIYEPQALLQYHLEFPKEKTQPKKSLSTLVAPQSPGAGTSSENLLIMNALLDEEKHKRESAKPWLLGRLALSKQTSRFELPMDVKTLESMTVMEYLTRFCVISKRRKALYKSSFLKVDKDRDGTISYKEMEKGLRDVHVDSINKEQINKIAEMVGADLSSKLTFKEFSAVAALSERLFYCDFINEDTNIGTSTKEIVEEADFSALQWKLDGFKVDPKLKKIFESL